MKADVVERGGDTWENLERKHGLQLNVILRRSNEKKDGRVMSAEEVER
jgi:hypothetical protein